MLKMMPSTKVDARAAQDLERLWLQHGRADREYSAAELEAMAQEAERQGRAARIRTEDARLKQDRQVVGMGRAGEWDAAQPGQERQAAAQAVAKAQGQVHMVRQLQEKLAGAPGL